MGYINHLRQISKKSTRFKIISAFPSVLSGWYGGLWRARSVWWHTTPQNGSCGTDTKVEPSQGKNWTVWRCLLVIFRKVPFNTKIQAQVHCCINEGKAIVPRAVSDIISSEHEWNRSTTACFCLTLTRLAAFMEICAAGLSWNTCCMKVCESLWSSQLLPCIPYRTTSGRVLSPEDSEFPRMKQISTFTKKNLVRNLSESLSPLDFQYMLSLHQGWGESSSKN